MFTACFQKLVSSVVSFSWHENIVEIQLNFIRDPWIQEMKQSILSRHCRQRQDICFVDLICFAYVPAKDCSSSYRDCLMGFLAIFSTCRKITPPLTVSVVVFFWFCFVLFFSPKKVFYGKMRDNSCYRNSACYNGKCLW